MKVLQVNSVVNYGSTGRISRDIADVLQEQGHESIIAYSRFDDHENYHTYKIGNRFDHYSHFFKSYVLDRNGFGSKRATADLIRFIKDYQPDLIQLHNLHGYYLNIELFFNFLAETMIPLVWLLHDQWSFSGGSATFSSRTGNARLEADEVAATKDIYPKAIKRMNYQKNLQAKETLISKLDHLTIVTPSQWLADNAAQTYLNKFDMQVIYNGIDTEKFQPRPSNLRNEWGIADKKVILAVSNYWINEKGLDYLNQAAADLPADTQIVMIGVDDKVAASISDKIIKINRTRDVNELIEWYSTADILVNPTLLDNFPTINIEALACGTPVITYQTGGSGEAVDAGTGLVVKQGDQAAMTAALVEWPRKTTTISAACIKRATFFDKDKQYMKYVDLYNHLI